jgi:uncharacterized 2Fe-2S/4Fe-4S cluster protein (DUF4445 family)
VKGRYCTVTFRPANRTVRVETGTTVLEAAVQADIILEAPCGGKGRCGKCRVLFAESTFPLTEEEEQLLSTADLAKGVRLACRARVTQDCLVQIPPESQGSFPQTLTFTPGDGGTFPFSPPLRSIALKDLDQRLRDARTSDVEVLREMSGTDRGDAELPLEFLQALPERLRDSDAGGTAVVMTNGSFLGLTAGNREVYGVALDVGTTTVAAALMELSNGTQLSVASRLNAQAIHGADTISRINFCSTERDGLSELNRRIIGTVNDIVEELSDRAQVDPDDIWEMTVVGNTTMTHLFLAVSPKYLGFMPYTPVFRRPPRVNAARLGLKLNPSANVHVLPSIGSFVGADSVGVILTSGMRRTEATTMAVDIGTNGEILIGSNHRLLASSTAAGPALEGAEISCGMTAAPGAVERVMVEDGDLRFEVIGNRRPIGICGSGLVDLVAILVRHGVIDAGGRLLSADEMPYPARDWFGQRILCKPEGNEFVIYRDGGRELRLTQRDIRKIQLAKAAIRAGIEILKTEIGVKNGDIDAVFLAGAFGNYINKESAVTIGLLPNFPLERIKPVGNAAGAGAKLALLSRQARLDAMEIANSTEHVEFGGSRAFQDAFADAMMFAQVR